MNHFEIVEQEESIGRGETQTVLCKHLKYRPGMVGKKDDRRPGLCRIKFPCLRVVIRDTTTGKVFVLGWSNYHRQPLSNPNCGNFKIVYPSSMQTPVVSTKVKNINQWWADKIEVAGETVKFEVHANFRNELARFCGGELADSIMTCFYERIIEIANRKAA